MKVSTKPNFRSIGPKFGKDARRVAAEIGELGPDPTRRLARGESVVIEADGDRFEVTPDDVEIQHDDIEGWLVASDNGITVALDTELDDDLRNEGLAREFVNRVQKLRKDSGLDVTDRIHLRYGATGRLETALEAEKDYVMSETLAVSMSGDAPDSSSTVSIEGEECHLVLEKAS